MKLANKLKLMRYVYLVFEYWKYEPKYTRLRYRGVQVTLMVCAHIFGLYTIGGLLILEVLNFYVWYTKERTGELDKLRENTINSMDELLGDQE